MLILIIVELFVLGGKLLPAAVVLVDAIAATSNVTIKGFMNFFTAKNNCFNQSELESCFQFKWERK